MIRHVRLSRYTPLSAGAGLARTTARQARPAVDRWAIIQERSGGWCEARLEGCAGRATQTHHRITQKNGGRHGTAKVRHDLPSNTIRVCAICHQWITNAGTPAQDLGLALEEWQDPTGEPVTLLAHSPMPVWLDDDGSWHRYEDGQS